MEMFNFKTTKVTHQYLHLPKKAPAMNANNLNSADMVASLADLPAPSAPHITERLNPFLLLEVSHSNLSHQIDRDHGLDESVSRICILGIRFDYTESNFREAG